MPTATATGFEERLAGYAAATAEAIERYLPPDAPDEHLMALVRYHLGRRGKGLRPALCLATCEAFGGDPEAALPVAAAVELLHNAFLVRDDIEDESELRRGAPTLHRRYGLPRALNAGDALAVYALAAVDEAGRGVGPPAAERILGELAFMGRQTVEGQALELGWRVDNRLDLTPDDYLELIMRKTCWYTTVLPLRLGALIGGKGAVDLEPFVAFGFNLGAAFQIQDDILNLTGGAAYGKERDGDLWEGKRTLVLIHLLAVADPDEQVELARFLGKTRAQRTAGEVARVREWMDDHGSLAFATEFARGIAASAVVSFQVAFAKAPDSPARRFLAQMIPYMVARDR